MSSTGESVAKGTWLKTIATDISQKTEATVAKEFSDDVLKDVTTPALSFHETVSDEDITKAVQLVYAGSVIPEALPDVVKLLCTLALHEVRHPKEHGIRIFQESVLHDFVLKQFPGEKYPISPTLSYMALHQLVPAAPVTPAPSQLPRSRVPGTSVQTETEEPATPQETQATAETKTRLSELFAQLKTGNDAGNDDSSTFKGKATYTLQERVYIGAWAMYHMRCLSKGSASMLGYQSKDGANRMNSLINRLYNISVSPEFLPPLTAAAYDGINEIMERSNPYVLGVVIRAAAYTIFCGRAGITKKQISDTLRGLLMIVVFQHALTAFVWTEQLADAAHQPATQVLANIWKTGVTDQTCQKIFKFYMKYIISKKRYMQEMQTADKRMVSYVGDHVGGDFYPIARILDSDYLSYVGRKGNEAYIVTVITAMRELSGVQDAYNTYTLPPCKLKTVAESVGIRFAKAVKKMYENADEAEFLALADGKKKHAPVDNDDSDDDINIPA